MLRTFVSLGAAMLLAVAAHAETPAPLSTTTPGKLTHAVTVFAPFTFLKDNQVTGFDVDMGAEIARHLGLESNPLYVEFRGAIPALLGGRVDFINAAMYITEERSQQVDFVPYLRIGTEIVVAKANPTNITGRDDSVCGKRIAVTLGGIQETYARADDARCKAAGLAGVTVMTVPSSQDSLLMVRNGRADALFDSTPGAVKATTELPDVFAIAGTTFESNSRLGYAVRKDDPAMRQGIEAALAATVKDGTYDRLLEKWSLPSSMSLFK